MHDKLLRYHRRDIAMKVSAVLAFGTIALLVAAPFAIEQKPSAPIPSFKPYRTEVVQLTQLDEGDSERLPDTASR